MPDDILQAGSCVLIIHFRPSTSQSAQTLRSSDPIAGPPPQYATLTITAYSHDQPEHLGCVGQIRRMATRKAYNSGPWVPSL